MYLSANSAVLNHKIYRFTQIYTDFMVIGKGQAAPKEQ